MVRWRDLERELPPVKPASGFVSNTDFGRSRLRRDPDELTTDQLLRVTSAGEIADPQAGLGMTHGSKVAPDPRQGHRFNFEADDYAAVFNEVNLEGLV